jgi:hypothetical protein
VDKAVEETVTFIAKGLVKLVVTVFVVRTVVDVVVV